MPISRYEIRNEYSLADSEVYRAVDRDDPEALLEGVAMAGLVGLLRQLGDLAEFAAEIFHNLHEEVTATAARGHGLMTRVRQLETEIPSIERVFLSQTDHSLFFYHAGVDWHPNLRLNQNVVTQGDLPGFIMDSYEESRAPPRLFLLDKFDVAGAGACLKRYTNPSFYKVETSEMIGVEVKREKKIRKGKKKGPRWRNGGTTEVLPTSHSKLHQLFLEERAENGVRSPSIRAKLKRRLNGFPFDLKTGKSYMERLLKSPSPDHKVLCEVTVNSSLMMSVANDHKESGFERFEARRSPPPSPYREDNVLNPSMYEPNKPPIDDKRFEVPNSRRTAKYGVSSTLDKATGEKVVAVDAQSHKEDSLTGYQSDDIASEIDNYVDAPSSIESEMDGDSESRVKSDPTSPIIKRESLFPGADKEHLRTRPTDSQLTGCSTKCDEGNYSTTKQISSFCFDSPSTSAEIPQTENFSAEGFQYIEVPDEDFQVDHQSRPDNTCTVTDGVNHQRSEHEQLTSSVCNNRSIPELDEMVCTLNDKEEKENLVMDPPCSPSLCDLESQSGDDSPGSSAGEHLVNKPDDESLPCVSTEPDSYYHTTDSSFNTSLYSLHEDAFDGKDRNSADHIASTLSMFNDLSTNVTPETISSKNQIPVKLENEVPEVREDSPDYPGTSHNGNSVVSAVSKEDNLIDGLYDEDSNSSTDSPSHFPSIMGGSSNGSTDSNVGNDHSHSSIDDQIGSQILNWSDIPNSPNRPTEGLDAHAGDVISEETTKKETRALETLELSEVVEIPHIFPNDSEAMESSCCIPEDLEDTVEMDGISADLISENKLHLLLDKCDADKSSTTDVPAVSDSERLSKLVEEHDNFFGDSGTDGLKNDDNFPSECHEESNIVERVGPTEASASGFETDFCTSVNDDHPKSELSGICSNSDPVSEDDQDPNMEQCGVDRERELFNQSGLGAHAPDPEESIAQEKVGLPLSQLDQDMLPINHQPMLDRAVSPPNNPFSETNLGDLPPLPPLPPFEWRTGKLQHASSSIEGETVKPKDLSSQLISVPSDNVAFPLPPTSNGNVDLFSPTASPEVINSSLEEKIHHTLTEIHPDAASKEENVEDSSSSLEANTLHETADIPPKSENEQQQIVITISEGVSTSTAEEDGAGIYPEIASKENVENSSSNLEANNMHETTDLPPKIEDEEQKIVVPPPENVSTSAAEAGDGNRTVKLQWPRNPLVEDVGLLNKSKLRKVTERVRSEIHKVDERDSFLDQIRTKSFNLRPAKASRPSIRGPNTNLQVAAILEKANSIRQALAGSDEDDSDSWSDS